MIFVRKFLLLSSTAAFFAAAPTSVAFANQSGIDEVPVQKDDQWILSARLGFNIGLDNNVNLGRQDLVYSDSKDLGTLAGISIGKDYGNFRLSTDLDYRTSDVNRVDVIGQGGLDIGIGGGPATGVQSSTSLMFNVAYAFAQGSDWKAFAGLGAGLADTELRNVRNDITLIDENDLNFAFQAFTEIVRDVGDNMELALGARYWTTLESEYETILGQDNFSQRSFDAFIRLGYKFGGSSKAPRAQAATAPAPRAAPEPQPAPPTITAPEPAPEPAPAPKPQPKPLPSKPFTVYFGLESSDISSDARSTIRDAAKAYDERVSVELVLEGHADRAGSLSYNEDLSERRGKAVKDALIAAGVKARDISSNHYGERKTAVPTQDGVKEYKNRRVEIIFKRK